ncbi:MAG: AraC family transcriptional regulator [Lachnospiraceae bacterium]|nr:AraC family transcriptional regulator [Lachnospiraceae bacterium]
MWNIDFREPPQNAGSNLLPPPFTAIHHFSYMDYIPNWYFFWHLHQHSAELVFVQSGHGYLNVGNQQIPLHRGYVCIVPPKILHYYSSEKADPLCYYSLGIPTDREDCELSVFFRELDCSVIPLEEDFSFLLSGCQALRRQLDASDNCADATFQAILYGMLMRIRQVALDHHITPVTRSRIMIQDVLTFIAEHYNEKLTLDELSHRFGISPVHLNRLFKKSCGLSPINYIIYFRITQAIILLQKTNMSIADITYTVGYQNQAHFTKLFREQIGCTPAEFRQKIQQEQTDKPIWE